MKKSTLKRELIKNEYSRPSPTGSANLCTACCYPTAAENTGGSSLSLCSVKHQSESVTTSTNSVATAGVRSGALRYARMSPKFSRSSRTSRCSKTLGTPRTAL